MIMKKIGTKASKEYMSYRGIADTAIGTARMLLIMGDSEAALNELNIAADKLDNLDRTKTPCKE